MNIAIVGGNGKLGKNICEKLKEIGHNIVVVDLNTQINSLYNIDKSLKFNAFFDVSNHKNSIDSLNFAKENKVPIIIGCTGHSEDELKQIKSASKEIPVFLSYNFSIALQYFYKAIETLSLLNSINYITEAHHNKKKDKPSGTALEIQNIINKNSKIEEIFSIRAGNILGSHLVNFVCENEEITISHNVFDRKVFATGAIFALNFIIKQKTGLFSMKDIIKTAN